MTETFVFEMNGQKVEFMYVPSNESPFKKADTGTAVVTSGGVKLGDFPCEKTSFVPFPSALMK